MTAGIAESWDRIRAWLARNAPRTYAVLNPPARPEQIAAAEQEIGLRFPADLVAWWRCVNGVRDFADGRVLPDCVPYDVTGMLKSRRLWMEVAEEAWDEEDRRHELAQPPGTTSLPFLAAWVPIGYDGGGDDMVVDLREGPQRGCVMWYSHEQGALWEPDWPDLSTMLAEIAEGLENGDRVGCWTPRVEESRLVWDIES